MKRYAKLVPLVKNPQSVKSSKDLAVDEAIKALARSLEQVRDLGSFEITSATTSLSHLSV
jgi:hypothetical protein